MGKPTKDCIIALDQGSGSSRALAYDCHGKIVAKAQYPLKTFYPREGWMEHDVREIVRSQERALREVLSEIPAAAKVLGLGISSQRSTLIAWDERSGIPLTRALSWQDGRARSVLGNLSLQNEEIHARTGLYANPYYSAPKLRWLVENVSGVKKAAERGTLRAGSVASYLLWHWTRGEIFGIDPSLAQRTLLFNLHSMDWDPDLLSAFGVLKEWLPKILPSSSGDWGALRLAGRKIPILAVLGDQQAAARGLCAEAPGSAIANYGTGAFLLLNVGSKDIRVPGLLTSVAATSQRSPSQFYLEGTVHAAATSLEWLASNFGFLKHIKDAQKLCRKSTQRVLALPSIGGLGAPRWDYRTPASFFGLHAKTQSADLVRGIVEGVGFLMSDIALSMRASGRSIESLRVSGGLSKVDYLMQFQSDILQTPMTRIPDHEATALGAASLVAEFLDFSEFSRAKLAGKEKVFKPRMEPQQARKLVKGWEAFVLSQQKLSTDLGMAGFPF